MIFYDDRKILVLRINYLREAVVAVGDEIFLLVRSSRLFSFMKFCELFSNYIRQISMMREIIELSRFVSERNFGKLCKNFTILIRSLNTFIKAGYINTL